MLRPNPGNPDEVLYSVHGGENGFRTAVRNIKTGYVRYTDRALASVSPCGKWGLSINFPRVFDFRPGYGYAGFPDPFRDYPLPENDGVYLTDLETGKSRLIISYRRISDEFPNPAVSGDKLTVNHITFSPDSGRFLFLVRNTPASGKGWKTLLLTSDRAGNLRRVIDYSIISHYFRKNEKQILAWCAVGGKTGVWLFDDAADVSEEKGTARRFDTPCFASDLHCSYSPDARYILGDAYPDNDGFRPIYLFDTQTGKERLLLRSHSPNPPIIDIRCDLHARFHPSGEKISFDAIDNGRRRICEAEVY